MWVSAVIHWADGEGYDWCVHVIAWRPDSGQVKILHLGVLQDAVTGKCTWDVVDITDIP